jgi:16S rRNA A1518/A1519 N6-dimethyltransferase RsmA/KsgA/DIM1 with predicted DNA glycosylase/AP lyase activity
VFFGSFIPGKTLSPMVFTSGQSKKRILKLAQITPDDVFVELGCGKGDLLIAAKKAGAKRAIGYEIAPLQYFWSKINAFFARTKIEVHLRDFMTADFSEATIVYLFLLPSALEKMKDLILSFPPGTRVISNSYEITYIEPKITDYDGTRNAIYLYEIPS